MFNPRHPEKRLFFWTDAISILSSSHKSQSRDADAHGRRKNRTQRDEAGPESGARSEDVIYDQDVYGHFCQDVSAADLESSRDVTGLSLYVKLRLGPCSPAADQDVCT